MPTSPTHPRPRTVRVALIGTGGMANEHVKLFRAVPGCRLVAAADVDRERAREFARRHDISESFGSAEELLAGCDFDAASIVAPDAAHATLSILCLKAGKHVLCEKPLATSHAEARQMAAVARRSGTVAMVNFSYRNWSALQGVAAVVASGRLGELRHVEASYLQSWLVSRIWGDWRTGPAWLWRLSTQHGSLGVLGDVGVHILDFATYPAGPLRSVHCRLKTFSKALGDRIGEYRLDANDSAVITAEFANGALGTIHTTRWACGHVNRLYLKISGSLGTVEIDSERATDSYRICAGRDVHGPRWREVRVKPTPTNHARFIRSIRTGAIAQPDFAEGAAIQRVLDACFESDARGTTVRV